MPRNFKEALSRLKTGSKDFYIAPATKKAFSWALLRLGLHLHKALLQLRFSLYTYTQKPREHQTGQNPQPWTLSELPPSWRAKHPKVSCCWMTWRCDGRA